MVQRNAKGASSQEPAHGNEPVHAQPCPTGRVNAGKMRDPICSPNTFRIWIYLFIHLLLCHDLYVLLLDACITETLRLTSGR